MNMKRMRGRGNFRQGGGYGGGQGAGPPRPQQNTSQQPMNRNHVFDSIGPDMRMRGTAQQLFEKYLQVGRDATSSGDRVAAEGYFQHAEHYFRILGAMNQAQQGPGPVPGGQGGYADRPDGRGGYGNRRYEDRQGYENGPPQEGGEEGGPLNGHAGPDGPHEAADGDPRETLQ